MAKRGGESMAKDDYFVIVYRLLKYLYDCLKRSKTPNMEVLDADFFSIKEPYWEYIVRNLYTEGYISGIVLFPVLGRSEKAVKITPDIKITPKGIQYIEENSVFQKVKEAVKDIAGIIPL